MAYTFEQLKGAVNECTSYDLVMVDNEDEDVVEYYLVDPYQLPHDQKYPYGDIDGDPFYDLEDVADYISNNEQVDQYLTSMEVYA